MPTDTLRVVTPDEAKALIRDEGEGRRVVVVHEYKQKQSAMNRAEKETEGGESVVCIVESGPKSFVLLAYAAVMEDGAYVQQGDHGWLLDEEGDPCNFVDDTAARAYLEQEDGPHSFTEGDFELVGSECTVISYLGGKPVEADELAEPAETPAQEPEDAPADDEPAEQQPPAQLWEVIRDHPVPSVVRWMGTRGWSSHQASSVLQACGVMDIPSESTLDALLADGQTCQFGKPADLTRAEEEALEKFNA